MLHHECSFIHTAKRNHLKIEAMAVEDKAGKNKQKNNNI